jgi:phage I-like protein
MNVAEWIGIIGGAAGLAVLLGAAYIGFKGSYNKARIEALRGDLADANVRLDAERDSRMKDEGRIDKLESEVRHLSSENELLRDLVTQRADVAAIATALSAHHDEALGAIRRHHEASMEHLTSIEEAIRGR